MQVPLRRVEKSKRYFSSGLKLFFIATAAAVLSIVAAVLATAKDNAAQAELDSMSARVP